MSEGDIFGLQKMDPMARRALASMEAMIKAIDFNNRDDIEKHLNPLGCAVIIEAQHGCMRCRGVKKQNAVMTTSAMRGVFFDKPEARTELLQLIRSAPIQG